MFGVGLYECVNVVWIILFHDNVDDFHAIYHVPMHPTECASD